LKTAEILKNKKAITDESVHVLHGTTGVKRKPASIISITTGTTRTTGGYGKLNPTKNLSTTYTTHLSSLEHFYRGGRVHTQPL